MIYRKYLDSLTLTTPISPKLFSSQPNWIAVFGDNFKLMDNAPTWSSVDDFLAHCCEKNEVDLDYVRSDDFYNLLRDCNWNNSQPYEALFYSRTRDLDIVLDRSLARPWVMDKRLFVQGSDPSVWKTRRFAIDLSRGHKRFRDCRLKKILLEEKRTRGTKYAAISQFEKNGSKVQADIIATRSVLVEPILAAISPTKFLAWIYAVNDQLFLESDKKSSPINAATMTGFNFEELMTVRQKVEKKRFRFEWAKDNCQKYNSIVRHSCSLLNTSLLVSCEIDAVRPVAADKTAHESSAIEEKLMLEDGVKNLSRYVEFKARVEHNSGIHKFHPALVQCYLANTPTLVVGIKKGYNLTEIKEWNVNEILSNGTLRLQYWFLERWMMFIAQFMKKSISRQRKSGLQSFSFGVEGSKLVLRELARPRLDFEAALTTEFINWREKHPQSEVDETLAGLLGPLSLQDNT